jgi:hypothetical protein
MRKLLTKCSLVLACVATMSSCVSTNKGFQSSAVISKDVTLDPIKADIVVNETMKLQGKSQSAYFLFFRIYGDNTFADGVGYSTDASASMFSKLNPFTVMRLAKLNKVRSAAAYKALSDGGDYDFLLHPNYTMTTISYLGLVKVYDVTVTGYGAKYKNFRVVPVPVCCQDKK